MLWCMEYNNSDKDPPDTKYLGKNGLNLFNSLSPVMPGSGLYLGKNGLNLFNCLSLVIHVGVVCFVRVCV